MSLEEHKYNTVETTVDELVKGERKMGGDPGYVTRAEGSAGLPTSIKEARDSFLGE